MKKLFFTLLAVAASVAGRALTLDVTSAYITNPDFEGTYADVNNNWVGTDRCIFQPNGWTVTMPKYNNNDMTALKSGDKQYDTQFNSQPKLSTGGNQTYLIRMRWGSASTLEMTQNVTLPAGKYTLSADGYINRTDLGNAKLAIGDNIINFTKSSWTRESVQFTVTEQTQLALTYTCNHTKQDNSVALFAGLDNIQLIGEYTDDELTAANFTAAQYKTALRAAIDAAPETPTANIGTAVFQYPTSVSNARTTAQDVLDNADATVEQLQAAITAFQAAFTINAPQETDVYSIVMATEEHTDKTHAATFKARSGEGGYSIAYEAVPGHAYYNQAIHFKTQDDGSFKLYITDAAGTNVYICDGEAVGNTVDHKKLQLRCTTDETKALTFRVEPTNTEGIFHLLNLSTKTYVGANGNSDHGFYTADQCKELQLVAATPVTVTLTVGEAGFATLSLPYAVSTLPTGLKAYTVTGTTGSATLTLTEVQTLDACKAYLVESTEAEYTFSGYPCATQDNCTTDWQTGIFAEKTVPQGNYVLQQLDNLTAFYHVNDDQCTLAANRAYLTVPAASGVKAYTFGGTATAIETIQNSEFNIHNCYDLQGRRLTALQKGINIVNGHKVIVK